MERIYYACKSYLGKPVWVKTHSGQQYQGHLVRVTYEHLYLARMGSSISGEKDNRECRALAKQAVSQTKMKQGEAIWFGGFFALPLIGVAAVGFLGGFAGGFFGARLGSRPFAPYGHVPYRRYY